MIDEDDGDDQDVIQNVESLIVNGEIDALKVNQLKQYLKFHGLDDKGKKDALINRALIFISERPMIWKFQTKSTRECNYPMIFYLLSWKQFFFRNILLNPNQLKYRKPKTYLLNTVIEGNKKNYGWCYLEAFINLIKNIKFIIKRRNGLRRCNRCFGSFNTIIII